MIHFPNVLPATDPYSPMLDWQNFGITVSLPPPSVPSGILCRASMTATILRLPRRRRCTRQAQLDPTVTCLIPFDKLHRAAGGNVHPPLQPRERVWTLRLSVDCSDERYGRGWSEMGCWDAGLHGVSLRMCASWNTWERGSPFSTHTIP